MCLLESINLNYLVSMAIKPCDHRLKLSCDYCQYCMSLLVVTILQTEVYKINDLKLEQMDQYVVAMPEM